MTLPDIGCVVSIGRSSTPTPDKCVFRDWTPVRVSAWDVSVQNAKHATTPQRGRCKWKDLMEGLLETIIYVCFPSRDHLNRIKTQMDAQVYSDLTCATALCVCLIERNRIRNSRLINASSCQAACRLEHSSSKNIDLSDGQATETDDWRGQDSQPVARLRWTRKGGHPQES